MQPIAAKLRRGVKRQRAPEQTEAAETSINDLDAKIAELEAQLQAASGSDDGDDGSSGGSDSSDSDDGDNESSESEESEETKGQANDPEAEPKILRTLDEERIAPLPAYLLPAPRCATGSGSSKPKKAKTEKEKEKSKPKPATSGLEATVTELLKNYVPAEKRPFYCRVCQEQMADLQSFEEHRASEFHQIAVRKERQLSQCKLCRTQFTSPVQLQEHLKGKAHKERLRRVKERQQSRTQYS